MVKIKKIKIDFCIVGEPTNPSKLGEMIKIGRGSINGTIQVFGKQRACSLSPTFF